MTSIERYRARRRQRLKGRYYRADSSSEKERIVNALSRMDADDDESKDGWVTINGTHVMLGREAEIRRGPEKLRGMRLTHAKSIKSKKKSGGSVKSGLKTASSAVKKKANSVVTALKGKFKKATKYSDPKLYDDVYREQSGNIWKKLTATAKKAFASYTGSGYKDINRALRADTNWECNHYMSISGVKSKVKNLTKAIDQSEIKEDTILYRGIGKNAFQEMFKMSENLTPENCKDLIGRTGTDNAFMSCGGVKGTGFDHKSVQMEIMTPAGTKGMYVEPFSSCGDGAGYYWDGVSPQEDYSGEFETILQRGTSVQVLDADYYDGKYHFKVAVTGQDPNGDTLYNQNAATKKKKTG